MLNIATFTMLRKYSSCIVIYVLTADSIILVPGVIPPPDGEDLHEVGTHLRMLQPVESV